MRYAIYAAVLMQTLLLSYLMVPILIRLAFAFDITDKPGQRKVHQQAKPLLGGVAIFFSFFATLVVDLVILVLLQETGFIQETLQTVYTLLPRIMRVLPTLVTVLTGGFLIHLLGLVDDIYKEKLTYKPKFLAQFLITVLVVLLGVRTHFMPGNWLDILISIVWIVGVTNSFNLLDNLDGLTAGVSVVSALIFGAVALLQGQTFMVFILLALAGAALGFLLHNFHPSKLFMGDSGSLFLGYMFACLTILGTYIVPSTPSLVPVAMPLLILSIPLYDTFSVMFIRWRENRPLFEGDKRHFSHRLLDLGMSHRQAVIFIYLVSFCVGIAASLLPYASIAGSIILLIQAALIYVLITILIAIKK